MIINKHLDKIIDRLLQLTYCSYI